MLTISRCVIGCDYEIKENTQKLAKMKNYESAEPRVYCEKSDQEVPGHSHRLQDIAEFPSPYPYRIVRVGDLTKKNLKLQ